jgi:FkbM family methyltransferase
MTDYSQAGEQGAVLKAFKDCQEPGRFLEIGAWHPTEFSNVRALYESGWRGVSIEPSPLALASLLKEYGNDDRIEIVGAAVGLEAGLIRMQITPDAVSTSCSKEYERWARQTSFVGSMLVPVLTIDEISLSLGHFDFWSIDAEGLSADLFKRMIELELRPHCVCCEYDNRLPEVCAIATDAGYHASFVNGTNAIFVR